MGKAKIKKQLDELENMVAFGHLMGILGEDEYQKLKKTVLKYRRIIKRRAKKEPEVKGE